jgi:hypothetical protein
MPGLTNKRPSGYLEFDYENPWPGLVTNLPSSQIPYGAASSCSAMVVRGRLTGQPAVSPITGTGGLTATSPTFSAGENVCAQTSLQVPGTQQSFTVLITNLAVYANYVLPGSVATSKAFSKLFTFPTAYPRYARFATKVIGNVLYISSASQLGLYALRPTFSVASVEVLNGGGYFTSTPTVVFSDGGGTGASGTAVLTGETLTSITLSAGGTYISPPIVNIQGGATFPLVTSGSLAVAVGILSTSPNGYSVQEISAFTGVVAADSGIPGGSGYSNPTVAFIGGGGTGASATAVLSTDGLGSILALVMSSFGQNYTSLPTVEIIDPTGSGATNPSSPGVRLFNGLPFIGADFMEAISNRLVLGNIIGGDGNSTTSIDYPRLALEGAGYVGFPTVDVIGGGGVGGSIYALPNGGEIFAANLGTLTDFTGILTSGQDTITGVSSLTGVQIGMNLSDFGYGIPSPTTVTAITPNANLNLTGTFTNGSANITGVSSITGVLSGQPLNGPLIPANTTVISASGSTIVMSQAASGDGTNAFQVVIGNTITMSNNATETVTEGIAAYGYINGNQGNGYYAQPLASVAGNNTLEAQIYPVLNGQVQRNSSQTRYPDRLAWSAPNAYGYFDPNWLTAPGGYNTLAEAAGIISGLTVIESVLFVGHNGGETETTPNAGTSPVPFAFYPLWSSDQGVLVRYGSMAQYGTTCCFLSNNSAYMLNPSGLTEIGQNIANLLENAGTWNNGNFPLQGLYGSIAVIEGQMHYLIGTSSDDWDYQNGNSTRSTTVYDFNINESSWHTWNYSGYTLTAPIYQSFDTALYEASGTTGNIQIARDSWLLMALTASTGSSAPYGEQAAVYEAAPLTRAVQIVSYKSNYSVTFTVPPVLAYQFRTETPSIARMQQHRRILIEYEDQSAFGSAVIPHPLPFSPTLTLNYNGQQDPTAQTGTILQSSTQSQVLTNLNISANGVPGQILTQQADFGTFTGVCTSLGLSAQGTGVPGQWNGLVSLVRVTQVADLPKTQVP